MEQRRVWLRSVLGLGIGLFISRVLLEQFAPWPWGWKAALIAVACALGLALAYALRHLDRLWPLGILWLYPLWPTDDLRVAAWIAGGTLTAMVTECGVEWCNRPVARRFLSHLDEWIWDVLVFAVALGGYVWTLAPTILPADAGEFQLVGAVLGVAHPPGYALYTLIAHAFTRLPLGDVAWRINLLSTFLAALTLLAVRRTVQVLTRSTLAALIATVTLGVSTTFWAQATTANIRMPTMCLLSFATLFAVQFLESGDRQQLNWLALCLGAGVSHHVSVGFLLPLFVGVVLWRDPDLLRRPRAWISPFVWFLSPFLADVYIVIRAIQGDVFGTDRLVDARHILDHLLGRGFSGDMFAFLRLDRVLWERTRIVGEIFLFQFGPWLPGVAFLGLIGLSRRHPRVAVLMGGIVAIMAFVVATYRAPQSVEYLMPAYLPIAICVGVAAGRIWQWKAPGRYSPLRTMALVAIVGLVGELGWSHLPSYVELSADRSAREYAEAVLGSAPENARVLSSWHWATPLWYLQQVEGWRPDVEVVYLYPEELPMPEAWAQRIEALMEQGDRPLIVTNWYATYETLPYRFCPLGPAWLVRETDEVLIPQDIQPLEVDFGDSLRIIGYRMDWMEGQVEPGEVLHVELYWQPLRELEDPHALFLHLIGEGGIPIGQDDHRLRVEGVVPGKIQVEQFEIQLPPTAIAGRLYPLVVGAYVPYPDGTWERLKTTEGDERVVLEAIEIVSAEKPPVSLHKMNKATLSGPRVQGYDIDDSLPGTRRLYLHWQGPTEGGEVTVRWAGGESRMALAPLASGHYATTVHDLPAGTRRVNVEVTVEGQTRPWRGIWGSICQTWTLRLPASRQWYVPFGDVMVLIGVDAPEEVNGGQMATVTLRWLAQRPLVSDKVISVALLGLEQGYPQADGVPALGAIPTFKWIRGVRVRDPHLVFVGEDAAGEGEWTVAVYDAFTFQHLPPLDERIARLGLGARVPVGKGQVKP